MKTFLVPLLFFLAYKLLEVNFVFSINLLGRLNNNLTLTGSLF